MQPIDAILLLTLGVCGTAAFGVLWKVSAPYGRHARPGWGPQVAQRVGWIAMEAPASIVTAVVSLSGPQGQKPVSLVLLGLWQAHYLHRAFVYPLRQRTPGRPMPVVVVGMAVLFNFINGLANGRQLGFVGRYELSWLLSPAFLFGAALFVAGEAINHHADHVLLSLRKPGETGYRIPYGGLYRWISSPNYFGEILAWVGWAIATWSLAGAMFALFTMANLVPRALTHHRWYREKFPEYPAERRALLPYIW